ncbi:GTP cyclohydrolase II RibA [Planctobacterium marinum]|uniref:GTP cyclohydrolase II n=1 Tax=Planctobacterium marinum TaxID=1631968 RepID=A0AA48KPG7_9ALTE|nr:GTP cyclohydrolase-2 [Planctobacterium marinum]
MRFEARTKLPMEMGTFDVSIFTNSQGLDVVAVHHGTLDQQKDLPVRVHSSCFTSEVLGSQKCDCKQQLDYALNYVFQQNGIVLYLLQEGRGIGLANKIRAYGLQEQGYDTIEANTKLGLPVDARTYEDVKGVLDYFSVKSIKLMTNNPDKIEQLTGLGIDVTGRIPVPATPTCSSIDYLDTKQKLMGHMIKTRSLYETQEKISHTSSQISQRPFVHVNFAITKQSKLADTKGQCLSISCDKDWQRVHGLRETYDAIAVGANTWINDSPKLTSRAECLGRKPTSQPHRVIFGGHHTLQIKDDTQPRETFVVGADVAGISGCHAIYSANHSLMAPLKALKRAGVASLLVEGGPTLIKSFLEQNTVDKLTVFVACHHIPDAVQALTQLVETLPEDEISAEKFGKGTLLSVNLTDSQHLTEQLDVAI